MTNQPIERRRVNRSKSLNRKIFITLITILWGLFLVLNTWTESLEQLLDFQSFGFKWNPSPNFKSFFYFYDLTLIHPDYVEVKLGHFIGFAIMDFFLFTLLKVHRYAIVLSIIFAFITEFFQLFFGRDGRFYDLVIDSFGVFSVFIVIKLIGDSKSN